MKGHYDLSVTKFRIGSVTRCFVLLLSPSNTFQGSTLKRGYDPFSANSFQFISPVVTVTFDTLAYSRPTLGLEPEYPTNKPSNQPDNQRPNLYLRGLLFESRLGDKLSCLRPSFKSTVAFYEASLFEPGSKTATISFKSLVPPYSHVEVGTF